MNSLNYGLNSWTKRVVNKHREICPVVERKEGSAFQAQQHRKNEMVFKRAEPSDDSRFWLLEILFAVIIPPLGVYLHTKETNKKFWISLGLTGGSWGTSGAFRVPLLPFLLALCAIAYSVLVVTDLL